MFLLSFFSLHLRFPLILFVSVIASLNPFNISNIPCAPASTTFASFNTGRRRTTFLLPVLKEANVVDAGAQGILEILKGLRLAITETNKISENLKWSEKKDSKNIALKDQKESEIDRMSIGIASAKEIRDWNINSDIKFIYCTEFVLTGQKINIARLREDIESMGNSAMVVGNENLVKIHVHSNNPHKVIGRALKEGKLHEIEVNNMVDQNKDKMKTKPTLKHAAPTMGLISVSN